MTQNSRASSNRNLLLLLALSWIHRHPKSTARIVAISAFSAVPFVLFSPWSKDVNVCLIVILNGSSCKLHYRWGRSWSSSDDYWVSAPVNHAMKLKNGSMSRRFLLSHQHLPIRRQRLNNIKVENGIKAWREWILQE